MIPDSDIQMVRRGERATDPARWDRWVALATLAAYAVVIGIALALYLRYSLGAFVAQINSDSAANLLYAREIIAQHTLFPQWNDSTGVASIFTSPNLLFTWLMFAFVPDWFTASRIGIAIDQLLMFALMWWALTRIGVSRNGRLLVVAVLLIGPSFGFLQQTTLLAGKSWLFTWLLVLVCLTRAVFDQGVAGSGRRSFAALVGVCGIVFVDSANAAAVLPIMAAALAVEWLSAATPSTRRRCAVAVLGLVGGLLLGQGLRFTLLAGNHYQPFAVPFTALDEAGSHLSLFMRGMLEMFGAVPAAGTSPYSLTGAASGAKFLTLITLVCMPVYFALRRQSLDNPCARMIAVMCATSLAIRFYVYLFTGISVGNTGTTRYFIVEILMGLVIAIFYLQQRLSEPRLRDVFLLAASVPFLITSPLLSMQSHPAPSKDQRLAQALVAAGLHHGYASFWNAGAPTALSNGQLTVRQVEFQPGTIAPMRWLSSDRWYQGIHGTDESFLLLSPAEVAQSDLSVFNRVAGSPSRELDVAGYVARVYPFDIASRLGWQHTLDQPLVAGDRRAQVQFVSAHVDQATNALLTRWKIRNLGHSALTSYGRMPVNFGLHLLDHNGHMLALDLLHTPIPLLLPGTEAEFEAEVPTSKLGSDVTIEGDLVQEGVAWFGDSGNASARMEIPAAEPAAGGSATTSVIAIKEARVPPTIPQRKQN